MVLPGPTDLRVEQVSYNPLEVKDTPGSDAKQTQETNTVLIRFKGAIDPNLTITAGNKIISRVRDVRGRAMYGAKDEKVAGNENEQKAIAASRFGFLEKDALDPDTWLQVNSHTILMNIAKATAGTDVFPVITLADPGSKAGELQQLLDSEASIRVGEWTFDLRNMPGLPESTYQPLFTQMYAPGRIRVYVDSLDPANQYPARLRINSETYREGRTSPVWLHELAQVVLEPKDKDDSKVWPLRCDEEEGTLSCRIPYREIVANYGAAGFPKKFKVWVDEPPYYGRPGLWADDDAVSSGPTGMWVPQPYPAGDWGEVRELPSPTSSGIPDHWEASIRVKNLPTTGQNSIPELKNWQAQIDSLLKTLSAKVQEHVVPSSQKRAQDQLSRSRRELTAISAEPNPVEFTIVGNLLTVFVRFPALPLVAQKLRVVNTPASGTNPVELFLLPALLPKLAPEQVELRDLKNNNYRLEGDRLRAVRQVRLEANGNAVVRDVSVGLNNVDFSVDPDELTEGATYNVFVVIGTMVFPVMQEGDDKKLHQVTVTATK